MVKATKRKSSKRKKAPEPLPPVKPKRKLVTVTRDTIEGSAIQIGPPKLTRFERARIIGLRALQLSYGAPPFIPLPENVSDPITLATRELESKALPISIRRGLPDGRSQDIPLKALLA